MTHSDSKFPSFLEMQDEFYVSLIMVHYHENTIIEQQSIFVAVPHLATRINW